MIKLPIISTTGRQTNNRICDLLFFFWLHTRVSFTLLSLNMRRTNDYKTHTRSQKASFWPCGFRDRQYRRSQRHKHDARITWCCNQLFSCFSFVLRLSSLYHYASRRIVCAVGGLPSNDIQLRFSYSLQLIFSQVWNSGLIQMYISPASSLLAPNSSLLVGQHKKRPRECVDVVFAQRRGVFAQSSNQDRGRSFRVLACDNRFELKKSKWNWVPFAVLPQPEIKRILLLRMSGHIQIRNKKILKKNRDGLSHLGAGHLRFWLGRS